MASASGNKIVRELQARLRQLESQRRPDETSCVSTGYAMLDRLLPERGFHRGSLVEWLAAAGGSGATSLALSTASQACREAGPLVVVDRSGEFYPPAAVASGIDPQRLILVRVRSAADETWALDQALRSPAIGAVLCSTERYDKRARRRWQLAAEEGGTLGLLVCPEHIRGEQCWAEARLLVEPLVSRGRRSVRVEVLRQRGQAAGGVVELELDDETSGLPAAPSVAVPAAVRRSARA